MGASAHCRMHIMLRLPSRCSHVLLCCHRHRIRSRLCSISRNLWISQRERERERDRESDTSRRSPNMPSPAKAQQRAAQLVKHASATTQKAQLALCLTALREHGAAASQPVYDLLVSSGIIDDVKKEVVEPTKGWNGKKRKAGDDKVDLDDRPMPKMGVVWTDCPIESLSQIMADVEPTTLSLSNLRAMGKKHCKHAPRGPLLELFEAVFQLDVQSTVPKFDTYKALISWLSQRNNENGRIATAVSLPPQWDTEGFYQVYFESGTWMLKQRFSEIVVPVTQIQLSMVIAMNWSIQRATVRDVTGINVSEVCRTFFPAAPRAGAPQAKALRSGPLRLTNGVGGTARSSASSASRNGGGAPHAFALEDGEARSESHRSSVASSVGAAAAAAAGKAAEAPAPPDACVENGAVAVVGDGAPGATGGHDDGASAFAIAQRAYAPPPPDAAPSSTA